MSHALNLSLNENIVGLRKLNLNFDEVGPIAAIMI